MAIPADFLRLAEVRYPAFVFTGEIWVLMAEERQVNTVDEYWDESYHGLHVVYVLRESYETQIDRLLHVSPPMVDYDL